MLQARPIASIVLTASVTLAAVGCGGNGGTTPPADTATASPSAAAPADTAATPTAATPTAAIPDEHADPHDVPMTEAEIEQLRQETLTFAAAMEHIHSFRNTIQTETTTGEPAQAHRALDKLDYVLQWLPEIAQNSNVPKESWESVGENAQKLRDAFSKVHTNIDAGTAPDYAAVQSDVDAGVESLSSIEAPAGAAAE